MTNVIDFRTGIAIDKLSDDVLWKITAENVIEDWYNSEEQGELINFVNSFLPPEFVTDEEILFNDLNYIVNIENTLGMDISIVHPGALNSVPNDSWSISFFSGKPFATHLREIDESYPIDECYVRLVNIILYLAFQRAKQNN